MDDELELVDAAAVRPCYPPVLREGSGRDRSFAPARHVRDEHQRKPISKRSHAANALASLERAPACQSPTRRCASGPRRRQL